MQEYFVYFKFFAVMDWGKRTDVSAAGDFKSLPKIKITLQSV